MREERRRKKIIKYGLIVLGILLAVIILGAVLMNTVFQIRTIDVTGCVNSSAAEVHEAVVSDEYSSNSLLLYFQLRSNPPDAAFVESVSLTFQSPWHIALSVTEKTLYGVLYDEETGCYIYFDNSGSVQEISEKKADDVLEAAGSISGDASEGELLPLLPEGVLDYVIQVYEYIDHYDLDADMIYIDTSGHIYFDTSGITILLGSDADTAEKFENLALIIDQLEGRSGTLDLSAFETAGDDIIFTEE